MPHNQVLAGVALVFGPEARMTTSVGPLLHWKRLPGFSMDRVRAALAGEFDSAQLSASEWLYFDDGVGAAMETPTAAGRIFWERFDRSVNTDR